MFSAWERCQRYAKALREMLDSPSGEIARGFMEFKTEPLISLIWKRQYSKWIKLEPEDAAICSIATTGASLHALGETEYERLGDHAFQLVLMDYAEAHPERRPAVGLALAKWETELGHPVPGTAAAGEVMARRVQPQ